MVERRRSAEAAPRHLDHEKLEAGGYNSLRLERGVKYGRNIFYKWTTKATCVHPQHSL